MGNSYFEERKQKKVFCSNYKNCKDCRKKITVTENTKFCNNCGTPLCNNCYSESDGFCNECSIDLLFDK